jgi:hypothetical protein
VPEGVYWSPVFGAYVCAHGSPVKIECMELNLRLDTFTRCQETTDVYVSLISELVKEVEDAYSAYGVMPECVDRAKQIMEQKK